MTWTRRIIGFCLIGFCFTGGCVSVVTNGDNLVATMVLLVVFCAGVGLVMYDERHGDG